MALDSLSKDGLQGLPAYSRWAQDSPPTEEEAGQAWVTTGALESPDRNARVGVARARATSRAL